jgi:gliding motility-associated-like protein
VEGAAGGVGPYVFSLDGRVFGIDSTFSGLTAGSHQLAVQDANGCEADTTAYLAGVEIPYLELGTEVSLLLGNTQLIQVALNLVPQSALWTPADGLSCSDCLEPLAAPVATTQYLLSVTSADGCTATDSLLLRVLPVRDFYVPSAFSPNGDGINDFLTVFGGRALWKIRDLKIFSRWGELVFERAEFSPNEPVQGWDGSFRGTPLQPGVFVWWAELEFIDGAVLQEKGDVVLTK